MDFDGRPSTRSEAEASRNGKDCQYCGEGSKQSGNIGFHGIQKKILKAMPPNPDDTIPHASGPDKTLYASFPLLLVPSIVC